MLEGTQAMFMINFPFTFCLSQHLIQLRQIFQCLDFYSSWR